MQKLVSLVSILVMSQLACSTTGEGSFDACVVAIPDGGSPNSTVACAVGWSCGGGTSTYELQCTFQAGDFACSCVIDGAATKNFTVNAFSCDGDGALPAAQSACGWPITVE